MHRSISESSSSFLGSGSHMFQVSTTGRKCAETLPQRLINDDFCDCADGSDENATSACSHVDASALTEPTKFLCSNEGHIPKWLLPSRIGDGICDCCDGSDEAVNVCKDECFEVGRVWREKRAAALLGVKQGLEKRNASLMELQQAVSRATQDINQRREHLAYVTELVTRLEDELRLEEVCEYAEQLDSSDPAAPVPVSRLRQLATRSERLQHINTTDNEYAQRILGQVFNASDMMETDDDTADGLSSIVVARAFVESPTTTIYELQCNHRIHQYRHWSGIVAHVVGVALSPFRLLWELIKLPLLLFPSAGTGGGAVDTAQNSDQNFVWKVIVDFSNEAWRASSLRWLKELVSPNYNKRHKRHETAILRRFVQKARTEKDNLAHEVQRLEDLNRIDPTDVAELLFLLRDLCFQRQFNEYKYEVCPFSKVKQNSVNLGLWKEEENQNPYVPGKKQVSLSLCRFGSCVVLFNC